MTTQYRKIDGTLGDTEKTLNDSNGTIQIIEPGANLTNVDLSGANLTNANLTGTNFTNVDLSGRTFIDESFQTAILDGANLTNTTLSYNNFRNSNLNNVILNNFSINELNDISKDENNKYDIQDVISLVSVILQQ